MPPTGPTEDDVANRRHQLQKWIDLHFGGVRARFVEATEINQGELSGLLSKKSFGEKRARRLEEQAKMPVKYLERRPPPTTQVTRVVEEPRPYPQDDWPFKRVSQEQYAMLTLEQRTHIENSILLLLPHRAKVAEERKSSNGR